jgi:hypothetical protein
MHIETHEVRMAGIAGAHHVSQGVQYPFDHTWLTLEKVKKRCPWNQTDSDGTLGDDCGVTRCTIEQGKFTDRRRSLDDVEDDFITG